MANETKTSRIADARACLSRADAELARAAGTLELPPTDPGTAAAYNSSAIREVMTAVRLLLDELTAGGAGDVQMDAQGRIMARSFQRDDDDPPSVLCSKCNRWYPAGQADTNLDEPICGQCNRGEEPH